MKRIGLALVVVLSSWAAGPAPVAAAPVVADPAKVTCVGGQLQFAPVLTSNPDRNLDGSLVKRFTPSPRGKFVPVIMVHGWTGSSVHDDSRSGAFSKLINLTNIRGTQANVPRSLIGQLQRIPGAAVFTFDYAQESARWVTDEKIGPALAKAIDCLYEQSGEKIIVVAHSMGGLATRQAFSEPQPSGRKRADEVSTVVTFGTPELGSDMAAELAAELDQKARVSPEAAVVRMLLAACGAATTQSLTTGTACDLLPSWLNWLKAADSQAARQLRTGSEGLTALAPFPKQVRVIALAGDATFTKIRRTFFGLVVESTDKVPVGDLIVTRKSAAAGGQEIHTLPCAYQFDLAQGIADHVGVLIRQVALSEVPAPPWEVVGACFHTNLMRTIQLTNIATSAVSDDIAGRNVVVLSGGSVAGVPLNGSAALVEKRLRQALGPPTATKNLAYNCEIVNRIPEPRRELSWGGLTVTIRHPGKSNASLVGWTVRPGAVPKGVRLPYGVTTSTSVSAAVHAIPGAKGFFTTAFFMYLITTEREPKMTWSGDHEDGSGKVTYITDMFEPCD